jgi:hypothetical protein
MKLLFSILTLTLLLQCKSEQKPSIENDIFISPLDNNYDSNWKIVLKDTSNAIRFSKDFWDYFIKTHPKTSSLLFISPLDDKSNDYESLGDSSLRYYNIARLTSYYFIDMLADSAEGKEKENSILGSTFLEKQSGDPEYIAKERRIKQKLNDYKITPAIRDEFNKLKNILTWKDTSNHYILFFKKNYVNNIYKLYE